MRCHSHDVAVLLAVMLIMAYGCTRRQTVYASTANALVWAQAMYAHEQAGGDVVGQHMAQAMIVAVEPALIELGQTDVLPPDLVIERDGQRWGPTVTPADIAADVAYARGLSDATAATAKAEAIANNRTRSFWRQALGAVVGTVGGLPWWQALLGGGPLALAGAWLVRSRLLKSEAVQTVIATYKRMTDAVKERHPEAYAAVIEPAKARARQAMSPALQRQVQRLIDGAKAKKG